MSEHLFDLLAFRRGEDLSVLLNFLRPFSHVTLRASCRTWRRMLPGAKTLRQAIVQESYLRKLASLPFARCALILAQCAAVLDPLIGQVFYLHGAKDDPSRPAGVGQTPELRVAEEEDFVAAYGSWRTVRLTSSLEHSDQVRRRAWACLRDQRATGGTAFTGTRQFTLWCFDGNCVPGSVASSSDDECTFHSLLQMSIAGGGSIVGHAAYQAASVATKVLLIDYSKRKVASRAPIGVYNDQGGQILASVSSAGRRAAKLHDAVHKLRAGVGIGLTKTAIGGGQFGELRPPVDQHAHWFTLRVYEKDQKRRLRCRSSCRVKRGDVLRYAEGLLEQVSDPDDMPLCLQGRG